MCWRSLCLKQLFERFNLDIENSWEFCGVTKETVVHLFFQFVYSRMFWTRCLQPSVKSIWFFNKIELQGVA